MATESVLKTDERKSLRGSTPLPSATKIPCAYCGIVKSYPDEFPVHHYAQCKDCLDEDSKTKWTLKEVIGFEKFLINLSGIHKFFKWILKGVLKSYWPKKIGEQNGKEKSFNFAKRLLSKGSQEKRKKRG